MTSPSRQFTGLPAPNPVTFTVDAVTYTLDDIPTRDWFEVLTTQRPACWLQILPNRLAGTGPQELAQRVVDDEDDFDIDDMERIAEAVISQACGTDFEAARNLAISGYSNWMIFDGWCASRGFAPLDEPVSRAIAAVYAWRRSLCVEKGDLAKLDAEIFVMPPGTTVSGRPRRAEPAGWTDEVEAAGFMSAMANLTGRRPARPAS